MTHEPHELGSGGIGKLLLRYSLPAAAGMLVNALYNLVDTIFVGQGAGVSALGALTVSFPIQMFVLAVAQVVGIGSASLISRSLGAGNSQRACQTAGTSFTVSFLLGLLVAILGMCFMTPLLRLFGATDAVLPYARQYLSIILLGSPFFAFTVSTNGVVRSEGKAFTGMFIMLMGALINIILDPIFIFGFDMGIRGAAIATVIANLSTAAALAAFYLRGRSELRIRRRDLIPQMAVLPEILRVGSPAFIRVAGGSLVHIVVNNSIAYYGTEVHLALMGISTRLMLFILMPLFGIVQGLQPIVGFNYGAQKPDRVRHAVRKATLVALGISGLGSLVIITAIQPLLRLFSPDQVLLAQGPTVLRILAISLPLVGYQVIGASLFQALGRALPALLLTLLRQIICLIPLVLLLPRILGLSGIWWAHPLADAIAAILTAYITQKSLRELTKQPGDYTG